MLKVLPPFKVLKSVHSMHSFQKNVVVTGECLNSAKLTSDFVYKVQICINLKKLILKLFFLHLKYENKLFIKIRHEGSISSKCCGTDMVY